MRVRRFEVKLVLAETRLFAVREAFILLSWAAKNVNCIKNLTKLICLVYEKMLDIHQCRTV